MPDSQRQIDVIIDLLPVLYLMGIVSTVLGIKVEEVKPVSLLVPGWNYSTYSKDRTDEFAEALEKERDRRDRGPASALT